MAHDRRCTEKSEPTLHYALCIVGDTVCRRLFGNRPAFCVLVPVKQFPREVVGILASKDQADVVMVHLRSLLREVN